MKAMLALDPAVLSVKLRFRKRDGHRMSLLIIAPLERREETQGVLWIHGGGYYMGMKEMAFFTRAMDLVKNHGAVVVSPGYRLAISKPYPAAVEDCYDALLYLKDHAAALGVRSDQIMVGGESAGGGLTAALCMMARDRGEVNVAYQMPLYPMLDNRDTETSRDNHGKVWNTRRNHRGWKIYLRSRAKCHDDPYASPACQTDYTRLPPAYTFVGSGEPFLAETLDYVKHLQEAGVEASADVYPTDVHSFDMYLHGTDMAKEAIGKFNEHFAYAQTHYFAPNGPDRKGDGTEHRMRLQPEPFRRVREGKKKIEMRLWDEKRQKIRPGDVLRLENEVTGEVLVRRAGALHVFDSFEDLYRALPLRDLGYAEEELPRASFRDMEAYYPPERQRCYGVVGIELLPEETENV